MKNYFENENRIVSFEKALYVLIDEKNRLFVCVEKGLLLEFPIGNWNFYKDWLDAKWKALEKETYQEVNYDELSKLPDGYVDYSDKFPFKTCSCSEKDTSRDVVLTRMQAKSVLSVLESIAIQKNTALEDAYNVLKDRLGSVAKLYQSQFTCSEKANDINHLPDAGKVVLSRDILQTIVDKVGCRYCTVDHLSQDCKNCYSYSNIKISDEIVKEINELIKEV